MGDLPKNTLVGNLTMFATGHFEYESLRCFTSLWRGLSTKMPACKAHRLPIAGVSALQSSCEEIGPGLINALALRLR